MTITQEAVEKRRAEILAEAQEYIAAAEPHLRRKWAAEVREHECHENCDGLWKRGLLDAANIVEGDGE